MRRAPLAPVLLLALAFARATPAWAQPVTITSAAPEAVSVTVYRDPERSGGGSLELRWLGGFALVTERRTVALPAGGSVIRFEGVAGGIVPASAIVTGLPGGVVEKNRDARLLSAAALIDGSLGRRVTLRRTDRGTGRVGKEDAIIRSGSANGLVVETRAGIEALGCGGLAETPVYARVPPGLSARPTLSVETRAPRATTATVTLSYLTSDFDWEASYVARIAPGGRTLDLFAWLTLANGNGEAFDDAELQAVAGTLNRVDGTQRFRPDVPGVELHCWPQGNTSTISTIAPVDPPAIIVVTAMRKMAMAAPAPPPPPPAPVARQEALGDLKLYRLPERVTIAPLSQKQVTLLRRGVVPFALVHAFAVDAGTVLAPQPATILLRTKNVAAAGLGVPLPAGSVALFARDAGESERLVGAGRLRDTAIGEEVELAGGQSAQVRLALASTGRARWSARLTNADAQPVAVEVRLLGNHIIAESSAQLGRKDGMPLWAVRVPAGGEATLSYRLGEPDAAARSRPAPRR